MDNFVEDDITVVMQHFETLNEKFQLDYATPLMSDMMCISCGRLLLLTYEDSDQKHECRFCPKCFEIINCEVCPEHQNQPFLKEKDHVELRCKFRLRGGGKIQNPEKFNRTDKCLWNSEKKSTTEKSEEVWKKRTKGEHGNGPRIAKQEKLAETEHLQKPLIEFEENENEQKVGNVTATNNDKLKIDQEFSLRTGKLQDQLATNATHGLASHKGSLTYASPTSMSEINMSNRPIEAPNQGPYENNKTQLELGFDRIVNQELRHNLYGDFASTEVPKTDPGNQDLVAMNQDPYENSNAQVKMSYAGTVAQNECHESVPRGLAPETHLVNQNLVATNQEQYRNSKDQVKMSYAGVVARNDHRKSASRGLMPEIYSDNQHLTTMNQGSYKHSNDQLKADNTRFAPQQAQGKPLVIQNINTYRPTTYERISGAWPLASNLVAQMISQFDGPKQDIGRQDNRNPIQSVQSQVLSEEELKNANRPVQQMVNTVDLFGIGDNSS